MSSERDSAKILRVKSVSSTRLHLHTVNKKIHQTTSHLFLHSDADQIIRNGGGV